MNAKIETFPQDQTTTRRRPASMAEIIEAARTPEEMWGLLMVAFPKATVAEVRQAIADHIHSLNEEAAELLGEADAMERVEAVVAQDADRDIETTLGESLERLAGQGDRDAAALLAEIDSPERREFSRLFDEAVEVDPFWSKTEDGRYRCKKGALHDTPAKLVAAYRARDPATAGT